MTQSATIPTNTIEGSGYPLGFKLKNGERRPSLLGLGEGQETFRVEARCMEGHQKEAIVKEGANGSTWRLTSDEGKHLKAKDMAPFPLGYFNAGLQADLLGRIIALASERSIALEDLNMELKNGYYMTGAFFRGNGEGFAEPAEINVKVKSPTSKDDVETLVKDAIDASPAHAAMRMPLENTFTVYVNNRRRHVDTMIRSTADDAPDPFVTYAEAPTPFSGSDELKDIITKTGVERAGEVTPAPAGTKTRIIRKVTGLSTLLDSAGVTETDSWLELPGMSHFALKSDERPGHDTAPTGLSLLSAGIAFCFMTQLSRYVEHMKFDIGAIRLVQDCPYRVIKVDGKLRGEAAPIDTHLFLNGRESDETHEQLMNIAARTCYLHATLADSLEPIVNIEHG